MLRSELPCWSVDLNEQCLACLLISQSDFQKKRLLIHWMFSFVDQIWRGIADQRPNWVVIYAELLINMSLIWIDWSWNQRYKPINLSIFDFICSDHVRDALKLQVWVFRFNNMVGTSLREPCFMILGGLGTILVVKWLTHRLMLTIRYGLMTMTIGHCNTLSWQTSQTERRGQRKVRRKSQERWPYSETTRRTVWSGGPSRPQSPHKG